MPAGSLTTRLTDTQAQAHAEHGPCQGTFILKVSPVMSLFITCPVESVDRATEFYTALGWTLNSEMSDHNVSCFSIALEQYVMLGSREMYASVGGTEDLIGGPDTPSKVTVSFDCDSREAVDALVERAAAAGGRIGDTDDYPFMYQRQFDDLDGYHYSPYWMKPDPDPAP